MVKPPLPPPPTPSINGEPPVDPDLGKSDAQLAHESWDRHIKANDSTVVDSCMGLMKSHLRCPECNHESNTFEAYNMLSLAIPDPDDVPGQFGVTLNDCLEKFTHEEVLEDGNYWTCSKCKANVSATKHITVFTTPDVLILHLKRFKSTYDQEKKTFSRSKIDTKIHFNSTIGDTVLDVKQYLISSTDNVGNSSSPPSKYSLFGVAAHLGTGISEGHYVANIRLPQEQLNGPDNNAVMDESTVGPGGWLHFNDDVVSPATTKLQADVIGSAYLMFFERMGSKAGKQYKWGGMMGGKLEDGIGDGDGRMEIDMTTTTTTTTTTRQQQQQKQQQQQQQQHNK